MRGCEGEGSGSPKQLGQQVMGHAVTHGHNSGTLRGMVCGKCQLKCASRLADTVRTETQEASWSQQQVSIEDSEKSALSMESWLVV